MLRSRSRRLESDSLIGHAVPGQDALIYDEAGYGSTWYDVGISYGYEGTRLDVSSRARRVAHSYARRYGKPWPLEEADALSEKAEARLAVEAEMEETHRLGKILYESRRTTVDWTAIAEQVGVPVKSALPAAKAYALAYDLPWPVVPERLDCGQFAYSRRADHKEPWPVIAKSAGHAPDYMRKAAQCYALRTGNPWPIILKDFGPEAHRLRTEENLTWDEVAARCHISRSWAIREARRYQATLGAPPPAATSSVEARAYEMRVQGKGWAEIRTTLGCAQSVAIERAKRHACANGFEWPIKAPRVCTKHSPQAQAAYERGYIAKESWEDVAASLGYASVSSAQASARCYADACNLPLDIVRRRCIPRVFNRPERTYRLKVESPSTSWEDISKMVGYPSLQSAHTAARTWALRNALPWPIPGVYSE